MVKVDLSSAPVLGVPSWFLPQPKEYVYV